MPQICDMGQTALLPLRRKACCGFFRPKNPTASAGIEPAISRMRRRSAVPAWLLRWVCWSTTIIQRGSVLTTVRRITRHAVRVTTFCAVCVVGDWEYSLFRTLGCMTRLIGNKRIAKLILCRSDPSVTWLRCRYSYVVFTRFFHKLSRNGLCIGSWINLLAKLQLRKRRTWIA
jgi:hypothetical protein